MADRATPENAQKVQAFCTFAGATTQAKTWNEFFSQELACNNVRASNSLVLTFAWNKFEEGAWIRPTLGKDATTQDTHYRNAFAQITSIWKY